MKSNKTAKPKVHILAFHFGTTAWLEIQKRHILKYTQDRDYKLWLGKYKGLEFKSSLHNNDDVDYLVRIIKKGLKDVE